MGVLYPPLTLISWVCDRSLVPKLYSQPLGLTSIRVSDLASLRTSRCLCTPLCTSKKLLLSGLPVDVAPPFLILKPICGLLSTIFFVPAI